MCVCHVIVSAHTRVCCQHVAFHVLTPKTPPAMALNRLRAATAQHYTDGAGEEGASPNEDVLHALDTFISHGTFKAVGIAEADPLVSAEPPAAGTPGTLGAKKTGTPMSSGERVAESTTPTAKTLSAKSPEPPCAQSMSAEPEGMAEDEANTPPSMIWGGLPSCDEDSGVDFPKAVEMSVEIRGAKMEASQLTKAEAQTLPARTSGVESPKFVEMPVDEVVTPMAQTWDVKTEGAASSGESSEGVEASAEHAVEGAAAESETPKRVTTEAETPPAMSMGSDRLGLKGERSCEKADKRPKTKAPGGAPKSGSPSKRARQEGEDIEMQVALRRHLDTLKSQLDNEPDIPALEWARALGRIRVTSKDAALNTWFTVEKRKLAQGEVPYVCLKVTDGTRTAQLASVRSSDSMLRRHASALRAMAICVAEMGDGLKVIDTGRDMCKPLLTVALDWVGSVA